MGEKQQCPSCRKAANEGHLRPNPVMEEAVISWKTARPYVLRLSKAEEQRAGSVSSEHLTTPNAKKRKLDRDHVHSSSPEIQIIEVSTSSPSKSPSKSSRNKPNSTRRSAKLPGSDASETEGIGTVLPSSTENLVSCPICEKHVVYKRVNAHIDSGCKDYARTSIATKSQSSKQQWSNILGPRSTKDKGKKKDVDASNDYHRLPKASYGTLKDKALKELLVEQGLPVQGDRNQWIERHRKWVMIYNANLDRSESYRKTKVELRRELKKWEEDTKKKKNTVDDVALYQKKQKSEFDRLVELARQTKAKPQQSKDASPPMTIDGAAGSASGEHKVPPSSPIIPSAPGSVRDDNIVADVQGT